jgi:hypothetical protein
MCTLLPMSSPAFDPSQLPPSYFDMRIQALERHVDALTHELKQAQAQLDWWRNGRALFAEADDDEAEADRASVSPEAEAIPETAQESGKRPTVRAAILRIMLDKQPINGEEQDWRANAVISEMTHRGWMPGGKNAANVVRRMLRDMSGEDGQLVKAGYGTFKLAPSTRDGRMPVGSVP